MTLERGVGYGLLVIGIFVMVFAAIRIIMVFTGKATPIAFFTPQPLIEQNNESTNTKIPNNPEELMELIQENPLAILNNTKGLPTTQLIDPQMINEIMNMAVYFLIMHFLLGLGFKIANLGVQLVRPVEVIVKNNEVASLLDKTQKTL